jgi:hypothetical protein
MNAKITRRAALLGAAGLLAAPLRTRARREVRREVGQSGAGCG